ncbi:hypothetical protein [Streptomyces bottropensis]|uniref:hypothetical protein n=1 Tax=Streptomyces bottropensis TaxID=42235 RepID=UPI00368BDE95
MSDQQEHLEDGPKTAEVVERIPVAVPIVTVKARPRAWDDDGLMDLPADAASHWDEGAWNRC